MTIESTLSAQTMSGDGIVRTFPFTFKAWENQLRVIVTTPDSMETDVTELCSILVYAEAGGVVTYPVSAGVPALPTDHKLTVMRAMDFKQNTDLITGSRYLSDVLEERLDKLTAQDQELREKVGRAVTVPLVWTTSPQELINQVFASVGQAAAAAASARLAAAGAASSAAESEHWADLAEDVVSGGMPLASPAYKGLVPAGGKSNQVYGVSADGMAYGFHDLPAAVVGRTVIGSMKFSPFSPAELAANEQGWYFMNGDRYALNSPQGLVLQSFPAEFKARWGIIADSGTISLPNFFHTDGRGYFVRAVDGTTRQAGSVEQDAMRPITTPNGTGPTGAYITAGVLTFAAGGPWETGDYMGYTGSPTGGGNHWAFFPRFNTARMGANFNGADTHGLNIGMTPLFFLGV